MKKTLKLWLALALALVTGVQAWAQEEEPQVWNRTTTFGFVNLGLAEDAKTAVSEAEKIFNTTTLDYVKELTAAEHVYNGGWNYAGNYNSICLGNATYPSGKLSFTLATAVKAKKIRVTAKQYRAIESKITVNGKEFELSGNWSTYTVNLVDEDNPDGQDVSAISIVSTKRAYIRYIYLDYSTSELAPRDISLSPAPGADLGVYLENQVKFYAEDGYAVRDIRLNLSAGNYTTSKPIIAYRNLTINGNGAVVDASPLKKPNFKGDKDTLQSFIEMADVTWPKEELNGKDAMYIDYVNINDLQVDSVKSYFFYDSSKKYVFESFNVNNCKILLKTAEATEAAFEFKKGGALAFNIQNSTVYQVGEKNVNYFTKYENNVVPDNGVEDYEGSDFFTYRNNTFYNVATSGQWHNGGRINQKCKLMTMTVEKNIWANCAPNLVRRLLGGSKKITDFTEESVLDKNTIGKYDADGKWTAEDQGAWSNKTELTSDPEFADVEEGDFHLGKKTLQNGFQTGAEEWIDYGNGNTYYVREYQNTGVEEEFLNGGYFKLNDNWANYGCLENNLVQIDVYPNVDYKEYDDEGNVINTVYNYKVKDVQVYIDADWGDAQAPRRALDLLETVEVTKMKDNQYYFFMPRANVRVKVIYERIVKDWWIADIDDQEIDQDFEGEVTPEVVVEDKLGGQLYEVDEEGNPVWENDIVGNYKWLWKDDDETEPLYKVLKEGVDYTLTYENNTQAGVAKAIVTGIGNYAGVAEQEFVIIRNLMAVDTEEEVGADGLVNARVIDEEDKLCEITKITVKEGETTLTIPAEVLGYTVVSIADDAADFDDFDNITDVYLPAIGDNGFGIEKTALLPIGFTHPKNLYNVHVPLANLDEYAAQEGLKKFAQYKRLMAEIEIGDKNFATFSSATPVEFEEAVEVSIIKSYTATAVTKEVIDQIIPANTGVLLFAKAGTYTVYAVDENIPIKSVEGNKLEAVTEATAYENDDDFTYFILKEGAFFKIAEDATGEQTVPACKAVLKVANEDAAAAASRLDIVIDGFTGINAVKADLNNAQIYDMQGRKVNNAQKGVYIVNGKKVVIK